MGPRLVSPGKEGSLHGARGACTQAAIWSGTLPNGVVETTTIRRVRPNMGQSDRHMGQLSGRIPDRGSARAGSWWLRIPRMHARM